MRKHVPPEGCASARPLSCERTSISVYPIQFLVAPIYSPGDRTESKASCSDPLVSLGKKTGILREALFQQANDLVNHEPDRPGTHQRDETENGTFQAEAATRVGPENLLRQAGKARTPRG